MSNLKKGDLVRYWDRYAVKDGHTLGIIQEVRRVLLEDARRVVYDVYWLHDGPPKTGFLYNDANLRLVEASE